MGAKARKRSVTNDDHTKFQFSPNTLLLIYFEIILPSLVVLLIPSTVHAAGFDCGGELTKLEEVICSDKTASKLDSKLNVT